MACKTWCKCKCQLPACACTNRRDPFIPKRPMDKRDKPRIVKS